MMNTTQLRFLLFSQFSLKYFAFCEFGAVVLIAFLIQGSYGLSCYSCSYSPDVPEGYDGGVFTTKCLDPDSSKAQSKACGTSDISCHKMFLNLRFEKENTSLQILYRMCSPNEINCITITEKNDTIDLNSTITPHAKSMISKMSQEIFLKFLPDVFKAKFKGRKMLDYTATGRSCGCDHRDNCNNKPGMDVSEGAGDTLQIQINLLVAIGIFNIINF